MASYVPSVPCALGSTSSERPQALPRSPTRTQLLRADTRSTRLERESPDCVLLDVRMPVVDGPTACERIRMLPGGHDTPVVFLTAQRDVDTFDRALRAGGDDFLTKPVQPSELLLRVQAALKLRKVKAELREHYGLVRKQRDDLMRLQLPKERLSQFLEA